MKTSVIENNKQIKRKKWKIVLISIISILIIVRLILPYVVLHFVNKKLAALKEYYGHVEDIDIALIRGAYKINNIKLVKIDSLTHQQDTIPFFTANTIDLSVQWKAIFKGKIVGEIYVEDPIINFVQGKHKGEDTKADTSDFKDLIKSLMPLTINHFQINNGQIHFRDPYSNPIVDVPMKNISVKAENLSNVNDSGKVLPSTIVANGSMYGGNFNLNIKLDPLQKNPTFDLNAGINNIDMLNLNNFFKAYGNFKVKKGNFGLYTEFAGKDGAFKGYVKPIIKDIEIEKDGTFTQIVWGNIVAGIATIFENHKKDQVATKIPVEGRFDNPSTGLWTAISYVLKNAFVLALQPSIDNTINLGKVEEPDSGKKTFLQKIFGKKDVKKDNSNLKSRKEKQKLKNE